MKPFEGLNHTYGSETAKCPLCLKWLQYGFEQNYMTCYWVCWRFRMLSCRLWISLPENPFSAGHFWKRNLKYNQAPIALQRVTHSPLASHWITHAHITLHWITHAPITCCAENVTPKIWIEVHSNINSKIQWRCWYRGCCCCNDEKFYFNFSMVIFPLYCT